MRIRTVMCALAAAGLVLGAFVPAAVGEETDPSLTQTVTEEEPVADMGTPVEISAGHVDMGPKMIEGTWELMVRDDSAAPPTWRHLDDVVFRVSDTGVLQIPDSDEFAFLGAKQAWVIPQQQIADVVWLGWNTQDPPVATGVNGGVDLIFEGHQGPGHFAAFVQAGNFSGPTLLWDSNVETSQPVHVDVNTHTHANWVFTEAGVHLVRINATAQLKDGSTVSDTKVLRFAVGDAISVDQVRSATWAGNDSGPASADNAPDAGMGSADTTAGAGDGAAGAADDSEGTVSSNQHSSQVLLWVSAGLAVVIVVVAVFLLLRSRGERAARERAAQDVQSDKHNAHQQSLSDQRLSQQSPAGPASSVQDRDQADRS